MGAPIKELVPTGQWSRPPIADNLRSQSDSTVYVGTWPGLRALAESADYGDRRNGTFYAFHGSVLRSVVGYFLNKWDSVRFTLYPSQGVKVEYKTAGDSSWIVVDEDRSSDINAA